MEKQEIEKLYNELKQHWNKYLKEFDVKIPTLYRNGNYTLNALALTYFYKNIGKIVSKADLTNFFRTMGFEVNDVQQGRHLANTSGWYIVSRTRGDIDAIKNNLSDGDYMLISVTEPYPSYKNKKRIENLGSDSWEELKKSYDYRCASCGSKEGEPNRYYPSSITKLEKGHMDPNKSLEIGNIIPQCNKCNKPDRNYFIYDSFGRVVGIADAKFILKSNEEIQIETLKYLINKYPKVAKDFLDSII